MNIPAFDKAMKDVAKTERVITLINAIELTMGAESVMDVRLRLLGALQKQDVDAYYRIKKIIFKDYK